MKAKLLKLLRKQAKKEYKIKQFTYKCKSTDRRKTFYVSAYYCLCRNIPFQSWFYLEHAEKYIQEARREYILFRIRELTEQKQIKNILQ